MRQTMMISATWTEDGVSKTWVNDRGEHRAKVANNESACAYLLHCVDRMIEDDVPLIDCSISISTGVSRVD